MSTATVHHPHHFSRPIAMAAAAVVLVGGVTAFGIAASRDGSSTAPVAPPQAPAAPIHGGAGGPQLVPKGGHTVNGEL